MATQGQNYTNTVTTNSSIGTKGWIGEINIIGLIPSSSYPDGTYAKIDYIPVSSTTTSLSNVRLVLPNSSFGIESKSSSTVFPSSGGTPVISVGGSSDAWSEILTPSDINNSNFGIALSFTSKSTGLISNYIVCTNFGFTIPTTAQIDGIYSRIDGTSVFSDGFRLKSVGISIYYTIPPSTMTGVGTVQGLQSVTF